MAVGMKNYYVMEGAIKDIETLANYLHKYQLEITEDAFNKCKEIKNILKNFRFLAARGNRILCSGYMDEDAVKTFVKGHFTKYNEELDQLKEEHQKILQLKDTKDSSAFQTIRVTMGKDYTKDKIDFKRAAKDFMKDEMNRLKKIYKKHSDDLNKMRQNITVDFSKYKGGRTIGSFTNEPYITIFNVLCSMKTIPVTKLVDKPAQPPAI